MDRRSLIRNFLFLAGGVTMLPACLNRQGKASIALKTIEINEEQEKLLAEIAATIIPQTDTPGAKEVGAHLFVLKMVDDCYEREDQDKFLRGLDELDQSAKKRFKHSFIACTNEQKEQILEGIEKEESFAPEVFAFYEIMKAKTIQGYFTSKYVLVNIMKYEMIPSVPYNGYHLIKNT
jgi:hypothetical protein